jgi:hypothetical protein
LVREKSHIWNQILTLVQCNQEYIFKFQAGEFLVLVGLRDEVGVVDRYKPCHDCGRHW